MDRTLATRTSGAGVRGAEPQPFAGGGGGAGKLTQPGAGAEVSLAPDIVVVAEPFAVVSDKFRN